MQHEYRLANESARFVFARALQQSSQARHVVLLLTHVLLLCVCVVLFFVYSPLFSSLPLLLFVASLVASRSPRSRQDFRLQCFQTLTGLKFLLIASPNFSAPTLDKILQSVYLTYCDYVLKNPFYELEMPIRLELFDTHMNRLIQGAMGHSIHGTPDRRDK